MYRNRTDSFKVLPPYRAMGFWLIKMIILSLKGSMDLKEN